MASFRFKLNAVLRHRARVEQDKQRDLALAQAERTKVQEQIRQLEESVRSSTDELRANHLTGPINLAYLTAHRRFVLSVQRQTAGLATVLQQHDAKVVAARAALSDATRDRKVLEKLREKMLARWREAQARREAADLDEVAMQMSFEQQLQAEASLSAETEVPL